MGERTGRPRFGGGLNFRKRRALASGSPITYYDSGTGRLVRSLVAETTAAESMFRTNNRVWLHFRTENLTWTRGYVSEASDVGKALLASAALVHT